MLPHREVRFASADGLTLFARDFPAETDAGKVPVLCLPGLTRNSLDFELALPHLTGSRRTICMDFRGRGQSQFATDPLTYRVDVEAGDVKALLAHLGLPKVAILGTSRGGLVGMVLAATAPEMVAGLLLNDVGPALEKAGLLRIRNYLGVQPEFANFKEAATALQRSLPGMRGLSFVDWLAFAYRIYRNENGIPQLAYDSKLRATFPTEEQINAATGEELWPLFESLNGLPLSLVHGENSDLLSAASVVEMKRRMPHMAATTVPDREHVPFLNEPASAKAISSWLDAVDQGQD